MSDHCANCGKLGKFEDCVCGICRSQRPIDNPKELTEIVMEGKRYNQNKPPLSMILEAKHALAGCAEVLAFGARKYSRGNWRQGLSHTETCDSLLRHMSAYLSGEDTDKESKLLHVHHILCNALFLSEMVETRVDKDDRTKLQKNK